MTSALLRLRWVLLALPLYCLSSSLVACASEPEDPNIIDSSLTGPVEKGPGDGTSGYRGYGYGGYGYGGYGYGGYGYGGYGYGGYGYGYGGR